MLSSRMLLILLSKAITSAITPGMWHRVMTGSHLATQQNGPQLPSAAASSHLLGLQNLENLPGACTSPILEPSQSGITEAWFPGAGAAH